MCRNLKNHAKYKFMKFYRINSTCQNYQKILHEYIEGVYSVGVSSSANSKSSNPGKSRSKLLLVSPIAGSASNDISEVREIPSNCDLSGEFVTGILWSLWFLPLFDITAISSSSTPTRIPLHVQHRQWQHRL